MSRVRLASLLSPQEASRFGFDWPPERGYKVGDTFPPLEPQHLIGPHIQVTRASTIDHGKKGVWRVLNVRTEKQELDIYVSPTGMMRVFKKGHGELVKKALVEAMDDKGNVDNTKVMCSTCGKPWWDHYDVNKLKYRAGPFGTFGLVSDHTPHIDGIHLPITSSD